MPSAKKKIKVEEVVSTETLPAIEEGPGEEGTATQCEPFVKDCSFDVRATGA